MNLRFHMLALAFLQMLILQANAASNAEPACIEPAPETGTSLAVIVGDVPLVHTAQIFPRNQKGYLVGSDDVIKQTEQVLANLAHILAGAKSELGQTVKLNVYLAQDNSLSKVQQVLSKRFSGSLKPAASFVAGALPDGEALVAIDAIATAAKQTSGRAVEMFSSSNLSGQKGIQHAALLPAGGKVYVSGMADTNKLPQATRKTLEKLIGAIGHLGLGKRDIVQLKAFLQPMSESAVVRQEIVDFFEGNAPPLSMVEWISPSPNPPIEIELIAAARGDLSNEPDSISFLTPPGTTSAKVFSRVARINHGSSIYFSGLYGMKTADAAGQVREIFQTMGRVLQQAGSDFDHLAKATYYVSNEEASNKLNELRPEFYNPQRPPAASKAKVRSVAMPEKSITLDMIGAVK